MKRINVFRNGSAVNGKILNVVHPNTLEEVKSSCSLKLGFPVKCIYTSQGGLIDDVTLFKDDDVVYASSGEEFLEPPSCKTNKLSEGRNIPECSPIGDFVTLNVGGKLFTTTRHTLTMLAPDSMLAKMFAKQSDSGDSNVWPNSVDKSGAFLIDRNPRYFEPVLDYLRHGKMIFDKNTNPQGVIEEAKFFGLESLVGEIRDMAAAREPCDRKKPLSRREVVAALMSTPTNSELRFQGINFSGADLSKLDLRYINFKMATLRHANLAKSNLSGCSFERADLTRANLEGATLLGVKMVCANAERSCFKGCNFDDPAGSRANMEGINLRGANLRGCSMNMINLRVANLRNSSMANCDLRGAVLAGADLENCDLSGCDLQSANLRGANLVGVDFQCMITPLHPTQTTCARARPRPDSMHRQDSQS